MENTKVVKPFIKRGRPNTFGNIVYMRVCVCVRIWYLNPSHKPHENS